MDSNKLPPHKRVYRLGTPKSGGHVGKQKIEALANNKVIRDYLADLLQAGATYAEAAVAINREHQESLSKEHIKYLVDCLGGRDFVKGTVEIVLKKPRLLVNMDKHAADGTAAGRLALLQEQAEERGSVLHELFMYNAHKARGFVEDQEPIPQSLLQNMNNLARTSNATADMLVRHFYTAEERQRLTIQAEQSQYRRPPGVLRDNVVELFPEEETDEAQLALTTGGDEEEVIEDYPIDEDFATIGEEDGEI